MVKYIYEKYQNKITYYPKFNSTGFKYGYLTDRLDTAVTAAGTDKTYYYTDATYSTTTGKVTFSGPVSGSITVGEALGSADLKSFYLRNTYGNVMNYVVESISANKTSGTFTVRGNDCIMTPQYNRGSYIGTVTAEDGTYPDDGRHTDGYWYVKGSVYVPPNVSPNPPTSISLSKTSGLMVGDVVKVKWSGANDSDGYISSHHLDVSINGSWQSVTTINSSSGSGEYDYKIPTGTTSIKFRVRVKDNSGSYSSYRESSQYSVSSNFPPSISGTDRSLGDYALPFTVDFTVDDQNPSDSISVRITLNNIEIKNISGAPRNQPITIEITKQLFDALETNSTNTIQIVANDGQGGTAYRTLTFNKTNTAPVISGQDDDLGVIEVPPLYTYNVFDAEGDAITIVERVNSVVLREFTAEPNTDYTFSVPYAAWLHFWPDNDCTIYIEATDARGAKSVRSLSFKRKTDKSVITLKNPFETDVHADRILLNPTVTIPTGAIFTAEACNNAFDDEPTWEDITERALEGRGYIFMNDTKTADKWGVNVRITLERGTATTPIILDGFGGAFD